MTQRSSCPSCRADNAADARFCAGCRRYLGWQQNPPVTQTPESGQTDPATAPATATPTVPPPPERAWVGTVGLSQPSGPPEAPQSAPSTTATTPLPPIEAVPTRIAEPVQPAAAVTPTRPTFAAVKPTDLDESVPVLHGSTSLAEKLGDSGGGRAGGPGSGKSGGPSLVPPPPPRVVPAGGLAYSPAGARCPACTAPVREGQRFCRCGAQVSGAAPAPAVATEEAVAPVPWWQRIFRPKRLSGQERDFRGGWRRAAGTTRIRYNDALALRARFFRATMLLSCGALGVGLLGPWGEPVRASISERVTPYLPISYDPVAAEATVAPPRAERQDFLADYAVDGDPGRAWATGWEGRAADGECTETGGGDSALVLDLGGPQRIDRVVISAGLDREASEAWARQARPTTVDLAFDDGTCRRIELVDDGTEQTFPVNIAEASSARVTIADAQDAQEGDGDLAALREVTLLGR